MSNLRGGYGNESDWCLDVKAAGERLLRHQSALRVWRFNLIVFFSFVMIGAGAQQALACRLALALGMDVSASVNTREFRLQMAGTAAALTSAPIREELFRAEPVALAAFLWSGARERWLISDWVVIRDGPTLDQFARSISDAARPPFNGRTATGEAMRAGATLLGRAPECARRVVDLATDGRANDGVAPQDVAAEGVVINALAIGEGAGPLDLGDGIGKVLSLSDYLQRDVIRGPGAFVERAKNYADIERAMGRKLLREMQDMILGQGRPVSGRGPV